MKLDGLMFDHRSIYPFAEMVGRVRDKTYVLPHILDDVLMYLVVKGDVF